MDKNWVTAPIPLNEKVIVWIKSKIKGSKSGTIVIEMKDSKVISSTITPKNSPWIWISRRNPMRILCAMLICFIAISSSFAEEKTKPQTRINYLVYERGWLINQGSQDILRAAVISPFYKYLGDIPRGSKVNVYFIRNKFTVEYTLKFWIGEYETLQETFIPTIYSKGPDVGLDMKAELKGDVLSVSITSAEKIQDIFIELLPDIPVKISNDRTRYVLSSVVQSART